MLSYLKIYPDLVARMRKLPDEQQYQLYDAMFRYAFEGITPSFDGVQDFAWSWLKDMIDAAEREMDKKREAGRKGAEATNAPAQSRQSIGTESAEHRQTIGTGSAPMRHDGGTIPAEDRQDTGTASAEDRQSIGTGAAKKEKEKEKEQEKEQEQEQEQNVICSPVEPVSPVLRRFDDFWAAYPKKTGKGAAQKKFVQLKVSDALLADMLKALEWQKASVQWTKDGGQYIPNPLTWLNQERWKDEPQATGQQTFVNPFWASMSGGPIE